MRLITYILESVLQYAKQMGYTNIVYAPISKPRLSQKNMQLFTIESSEKTMFTDLVLFPFLFVSPMVQEVIKMYRECCFFRKIILLDQEKQESRLYYLPVLDETNAIQIQRIQYKNGKRNLDMPEIQGERIELDRNLFWVRDSKKRHIILSLDMAESLIRRNIMGLGLCEVELYNKL